MKIIETATQAYAITDRTLRRLIVRELRLAKEGGLEALTCLAIVEEEDSEEDAKTCLGFSPLENPLTGLRIGDAGFEPSWDWVEAKRSWYRVVFTAGDEGFAYVLLVPGSQSTLGAAIRSIVEGV